MTKKQFEELKASLKEAKERLDAMENIVFSARFVSDPYQERQFIDDPISDYPYFPYCKD